MKVYLYSILDTKVGAFSAPVGARARGEAVRSFQQACQDDNLPFKKSPGDYQLYYVGEYDDAQMVIQGFQPERVIGADEF